MIVVIFLFALSLFSADLTQESLLEIIWDSTTIPSPQQFQEFRQRFPRTLLTPQQALAKIIPIAKDALNEYPNDIHLLPSYMQNLEQVCLDVAEILPEIAQMARNDDFTFLQKEYQDALYSPNFAHIYGIHMVLHTTDMFFLYKAFLEHPEKDQINQTLNSFGYTSNLPLLNIHSKEDLKHFLLNIKRNKFFNHSGRLFTKTTECPPDQIDVLFGFFNEYEPSSDISLHQFVLSCVQAHYTHTRARYIFTNSGLFSMVSDPAAIESNAHLISLPTKISSTSYTLQAHQGVCGLAHRHMHDYTHFLVRNGFLTTFDMVFEPAQPSQENASSLFSKKCMDYIENVILSDKNTPIPLHTLKMLYMFSAEHETRGMPTLMCSVQMALQKICSHWAPVDPDFEALVTFAVKELQTSNPAFDFVQTWAKNGQDLAEYLSPHFKFKEHPKENTASSTVVFDSLPNSVLYANHTNPPQETQEALDRHTFTHTTQSSNPFTHTPNAGALETSFSSLGYPPTPIIHNFTITVPQAKKTHKDRSLCLTRFFRAKYDTRPTPKTQSSLEEALDMNVPFSVPEGSVRTFNQELSSKDTHLPSLRVIKTIAKIGRSVRIFNQELSSKDTLPLASVSLKRSQKTTATHPQKTHSDCPLFMSGNCGSGLNFFTHTVNHPLSFSHCIGAGALHSSLDPIAQPPLPEDLTTVFYTYDDDPENLHIPTAPNDFSLKNNGSASPQTLLKVMYNNKVSAPSKTSVNRQAGILFSTIEPLHPKERTFYYLSNFHIPKWVRYPKPTETTPLKQPRAPHNALDYQFSHHKYIHHTTTEQKKEPLSFTVYLEKSDTPFSYVVQDIVHKTLVLRTPSLSRIGGLHHHEFLRVLAHILTENLTEYCCIQQYYQSYSANFPYAFAYELHRLTEAISTTKLHGGCATPLYKGAFLNLTCSCPKPTFHRADNCTGGSLFA